MPPRQRNFGRLNLSCGTQVVWAVHADDRAVRPFPFSSFSPRKHPGRTCRSRNPRIPGSRHLTCTLPASAPTCRGTSLIRNRYPCWALTWRHGEQAPSGPRHHARELRMDHRVEGHGPLALPPLFTSGTAPLPYLCTSALPYHCTSALPCLWCRTSASLLALPPALLPYLWDTSDLPLLLETRAPRLARSINRVTYAEVPRSYDPPPPLGSP